MYYWMLDIWLQLKKAYFSPSKYKKGMYAEFEDVYYAIRYVNSKEKIYKNWIGKKQFGLWSHKIIFIYVYFNIVVTLRTDKI